MVKLAALLAKSYEFDPSAFANSWKALHEDPNAKILVAVEEGKVAGYLLGFLHGVFYANGPVGYVEEILVSESFRGKGLGKDLMTAFEELAKSSGCPQVALATRRAGEFYKAIGYTESATYFKKKF